MLLRKLIEIRRADAELPPEIRAALVRSLFAPISSLTVGAINCSIIGMVVALSVGNDAIMTNSVAIFAVGMLRVVSAILYRRYRAADQTSKTKTWERVYEAGAWAFSALLGVLCWLTLTQTTDPALQMAVITTATGYAAAISGRNAGRPFIALGQFTSIMLPMVVALFLYPDWIHKILGFVGLLFMYGMMDITLGIREVIIQALTMTRKEAALAARFEEQANRFDIALNNMSHGLCMLDQQDRLQVWNRAFPRSAASQESAGTRRHEIARAAAPQHPRRQLQGQEAEAGVQSIGARPASGRRRAIADLARRRKDHCVVAAHDGRRRLGGDP